MVEDGCGTTIDAVGPVTLETLGGDKIRLYSTLDLGVVAGTTYDSDTRSRDRFNKDTRLALVTIGVVEKSGLVTLAAMGDEVAVTGGA